MLLFSVMTQARNRLLAPAMTLLVFALLMCGAAGSLRANVLRGQRLQAATTAAATSKAVKNRLTKIAKKYRNWAKAGSKLSRGSLARIEYGEFFKVDVLSDNGQTSVRLNPTKVKAALVATGPKGVTYEKVKTAWRAYRNVATRLRTRNLRFIPEYRPLSVGELGRNRTHVTRLSLADPGQDHEAVTVLLPPEDLEQIVVHHEFITRESPLVQPYRLPDLADTKVLVAGVAALAPVSVYQGLPNIEDELALSMQDPEFAAQFRGDPMSLRNLLRTSAQTTRDVSYARWSVGAAEVKVRMSPKQMPYASQMVAFMAEVNEQSGLDKRDAQQILSAQFNLNEPIIDDLDPSQKPVKISNPVSVARLSLRILTEVANVARAENRPNVWRKWAPDAAFEMPGVRVPFIELLGGMRPGQTYSDAQKNRLAENGTKILVDLAATAREQGLESYVSAGMNEKHMKWVTYAGVDVGIGTSMHASEIQGDKLIVGPLSPEKIRQALQIGRAAEASVIGRGQRQLYQMGWQRFHSGLSAKERKELGVSRVPAVWTPALESTYQELRTAMTKLDETKVGSLLGNTSL